MWKYRGECGLLGIKLLYVKWKLVYRKKTIQRRAEGTFLDGLFDNVSELQKLFNDIDKKGNLRTPLEHLIVTNKISCF